MGATLPALRCASPVVRFAPLEQTEIAGAAAECDRACRRGAPLPARPVEPFLQITREHRRRSLDVPRLRDHVWKRRAVAIRTTWIDGIKWVRQRRAQVDPANPL